jgi:hypothetical protein
MGGKSSSNISYSNTSNLGEHVLVTYCWIALRTMEWMAMGSNHWAVILELSNGTYANIQVNKPNGVYINCFSNKKDAALYTFGSMTSRVRLSTYGGSSKTWQNLMYFIKHSDNNYCLFRNDCQNFSRKIIEFLTDKSVGFWPIENGETFYP